MLCLMKRVIEDVIDHVELEGYQHVEAMLAESRRVYATDAPLFRSCTSCRVPYNVCYDMKQCHECPSVYSCGRPFCVAPFKVVRCSKQGCENMLCDETAHFSILGCGIVCMHDKCEAVSCVACAVICDTCDLPFCHAHHKQCTQ